MSVIGIDASPSATAACSTLAKTRGLSEVRFVTAGVEGPEFRKMLQAVVDETRGQVAVYARFFLHALTESEQHTMLTALEEILRPGDILAVEYRTTRDSSLTKVTGEHYRRFIDPAVLNSDVSRRAFQARYAVEGFGYAKFRNDDAYVARAIFVKTSPSEIDIGSYATNILRDWSVGARVATHRVAGEIVSLVIEGSYLEATRTLRDTSDLTNEQKRELARVVNDELLFYRELEWTNHSIRRSFRFWTPEQKVEYLNLTTRVIKDLHKVSPYVCLGFGSVLGAVRDRDMIPHDDDMDVIVAFERDENTPTISVALNRISTILIEAGFSVHGDHPTHRNVNRDGGTAVDVFVALIEEGRVAWYPSSRQGLRIEEVFPPQPVSILGVSTLIPREAEKYLDVTYGSDWRTPIAQWHHPWDLQQYKDQL